MILTKLVGTVVVVGILAVAGHDGYEVFKAQKDVVTKAGDVASAAATAIKDNPKDPTGGHDAANKQAGLDGAVVTAYSFNPVASKVSLTISVTADTWVLKRLDRKMTDNISKSASAKVPTTRTGTTVTP